MTTNSILDDSLLTPSAPVANPLAKPANPVVQPLAKPANPLAATPYVQPEFRRIGDAPATRQAIYGRVLESARAIPSVENNKYRLALSDVDYEGPETHSLKRQKKALLSGESLYRKLKGTWTMTDLEGNVVSQQRAQLARIPYMTDRGTFIIGGNEQSFAHQFRLKPGAYTRQQQSGLFETAVNPRKGSSHKVFLDPETGVFQLAMGQAKIPLMPLLNAMGVSNQTLRDTWGDELVNANNRKSDGQRSCKS